MIGLFWSCVGRERNRQLHRGGSRESRARGGQNSSDFLREIKSVSSGWVKNTLASPGEFGWQIGYAAFSVSKSNVETVRAYIARQQEHHARMTFQEEYLAFLERHEIAYDPRFVFEQELAG